MAKALGLRDAFLVVSVFLHRSGNNMYVEALEYFLQVLGCSCLLQLLVLAFALWNTEFLLN